MRRLSTTLALITACAWSVQAHAQDFDDDTGDPLAIPGEDDGGSTVELSAEGSVSDDSDGASGLGIGANAMLAGPFGAAIVYDPGKYHIEGLLGFASVDPGDTTVLAIGGRFFYHLHTSTAADFSLGGGLGFTTIDNEPEDDETNVHIEAGAQLRAFVVPNVAISTTLGLAVVSGDADFVGLRGQLIGSLGLTYFF